MGNQFAIWISHILSKCKSCMRRPAANRHALNLLAVRATDPTSSNGRTAISQIDSALVWAGGEETYPRATLRGGFTSSGKPAAGTQVPGSQVLPPPVWRGGTCDGQALYRARILSRVRAPPPMASESSWEWPGCTRPARPRGDFHPPLSIHHFCFTALGRGQGHLQQA